jgi:hypothetical protein
MVQIGNAYTILAPTPEVKIRLGGPRRRWEDNIKMDISEYGSINGGKLLDQLSVYQMTLLH